MTSTATIVRQPKGRPTGGEFAAHARDEDDIALPLDDNPFRRRYDTPEDKVKAFMGELETAVAALDTDEEWQAYLDMAAKFHHYSFNNQMLILIQNPDATKVAGFKRWQELGRQVRKGEKGIAILAPKKARVLVTDAAGRPLLDEHGQERREVRVIGVTTATVFDVSQTDGPELPSDRMLLSEEPPAGLVDDLATAITSRGYTFEESDDLHGSNLGYTTTDGSKRVVIKRGLSEADRARVAAHELGHIAAGHVDRHEDYHTGHAGKRGEMEVEADSISYAMLRANGMSPDIGRSNAAYVWGWSKRDPETVKSAGSAVAKAVKSILGEGSWRNLGE